MKGPPFLLRSYQFLLLSQTSRLFVSASPILRKPPLVLQTCTAVSELQKFRKLIVLREYSSAKMPGVAGEEGFSRLPTHAVPTHYTIRLTPNLSTFEVKGEETVDLELKEASNKLKLYAAGLNITSATVKTGTEELTGELRYSQKWETVEISFPKELGGGSKAQLKLSFIGSLSKEMKGFYRSKYTDSEGNEKYLATTQFESTYARRAFPCWDEPVFKSKFDVTLVVPQDKVALSNSIVVKEEDVGDGLKAVTYATTPQMSTYLVAFIVGDFAFIESKTKSGVVFRVYAVPGKEKQGQFALECGTKSIDFFEDFFGIDYPLPKCDLIAIPDFSMGAMENWGLVTYREIRLLVDEIYSSVAQKTGVSLTVGHELAHMWFGNLVTMEWWTDLWLKEGFATFMEYLFVADAYPEFQIWLHFVNDEIARAMTLDGLKNSHPIEFREIRRTKWALFPVITPLPPKQPRREPSRKVPINNPNEIEEIYDGVSYSKSASIIRMLYHHIGADIFQAGAAHYLKAFQFKNAVTKDLWEKLSDASKQDVSSLMSEWTRYMGYPLVSVSSRQEGTRRILKLTQKRFLSDGSDDATAPVWKIPISISTGSDPNGVREQILMDKKEMEFTMDNVPEHEFLKLNSNVTGFFRVEYSGEMLAPLVDAVKEKMLGPVDRFSLVQDLFALTQAGRVSATQFLDVLEACSDEDQYTVWLELDSGVGTLSNVLARNPQLHDKYNALIRKVYQGIAHKLGWQKKDGEDHLTGQLRSLVLGRLGKAGHEETIEKARQLLNEHLEKGTDIHPDIRGMLVSSSDFVEVKLNAIMALGSSPDTTIQKDALEFGMSDAVRKQDAPYVFVGCTGTPTGQDTVWDYFKGNMGKMIEFYNGANDNLFQAITKISIRSFCSEEKAQEVEEFFAKSEHAETLARPVKQSMEHVRLSANLRTRNEQAISDWLSAKGY